MWFEKKYTAFREITYKWRAKYFLPILKLLADLKITPNQITAFRLLFIFPIAYYFYLNNLWGVLIFYSIFWILDLFDGSLARYLNATDDKGGFLDTVVDHFMYSFGMIGFIYLQAANTLLLAYNIVIQLFVNLLVSAKNWRKEESNWLIKVKPNVPYFKTIAHLFLILYVFNINFLNPVFVILNLWMTIASLYYFFKIQKRH